jgi:hypothetical protein
VQLQPQLFSEALTALREADFSKGSNERRRTARFAVQTRMSLLPFHQGSIQGSALIVLTRDVSIEGLGLLLATPLASGTQVIAALPREKRPPALVLCTVAHSRPLADGLWGIGAEYTELVEADLALPTPSAPSAAPAAPSSGPQRRNP